MVEVGLSKVGVGRRKREVNKSSRNAKADQPRTLKVLFEFSFIIYTKNADC